MVVKYRLKFTKEGVMRFIGHLDLMRVFQRSARRAGLPMAYSQGFNPHQLMSFAAPLGLGMSSLGEILDITLREPTADITEALSRRLPEGIRLIDCRQLPTNAPSAAAELSAAEYAFTIAQAEYLAEKIISEDEIIMPVSTKRSTEQRNIRPLIYSAQPLNDAIKILIAAGSRENLKPLLLAQHMYELLAVPYQPTSVVCRRLALFKESEGRFVPL